MDAGKTGGMAMAITSAPQRSGRPAQHLRPTLVVAVIAVLVLGAIGVALALRGGSSSSGSGIQGSAVAATQTRAVPSFTSLDLAGSNKVTVVVGAPRSVVVHADTNLISHVTTRVVAGTLVIADTGSFTSHTSMSVDVDGQAQLSQLGARDVRAVLTGAGLIQVTATSSLDAAVPGSGLIMYTGTPSHVVTSVTGTGSITAG
jgi:hypothetical protein